MRHEAIQYSAAVALVAFALGLYLAGTSTTLADVDRKQMQQRLKQEISAAIEHSSLSAEEKARFNAARAEFRDLMKAQREGEPVDQQRLSAAAETLKSVLSSSSIPKADRERIQQSLHVADAMWREHRAKTRREALVAQLGYPMGLLADMVVSE